MDPVSRTCRTCVNFLPEDNEACHGCVAWSRWVPAEAKDQTTAPAKVKSNGASSDYYKLPPHATELRHLIQAKDMDFAIGNVFKACYRLGEKEGTEELYDVRKIIFFGFDELEKVSGDGYVQELEAFHKFIADELDRLA